MARLTDHEKKCRIKKTHKLTKKWDLRISLVNPGQYPYLVKYRTRPKAFAQTKVSVLLFILPVTAIAHLSQYLKSVIAPCSVFLSLSAMPYSEMFFCELDQSFLFHTVGVLVVM